MCTPLMHNRCHRPIVSVAECPIDGPQLRLQCQRQRPAHQNGRCLADSQDETFAGTTVATAVVEMPALVLAVLYADSVFVAPELSPAHRMQRFGCARLGPPRPLPVY